MTRRQEKKGRSDYEQCASAIRRLLAVAVADGEAMEEVRTASQPFNAWRVSISLSLHITGIFGVNEDTASMWRRDTCTSLLAAILEAAAHGPQGRAHTLISLFRAARTAKAHASGVDVGRVQQELALQSKDDVWDALCAKFPQKKDVRDRRDRDRRERDRRARRDWQDRDRKPRKDDVCKKCGEKGHWARECPNP